MPDQKTDRSAALKVLRRIAEDKDVEVASRVKAAELILKATEPQRRLTPYQQQAGIGVYS